MKGLLLTILTIGAACVQSVQGLGCQNCGNQERSGVVKGCREECHNIFYSQNDRDSCAGKCLPFVYTQGCCTSNMCPSSRRRYLPVSTPETTSSENLSGDEIVSRVVMNEAPYNNITNTAELRSLHPAFENSTLVHTSDGQHDVDAIDPSADINCCYGCDLIKWGGNLCPGTPRGMGLAAAHVLCISICFRAYGQICRV